MEVKSKSWLESITSIGGILGALASLLAIVGINIDPATVASATDAVNAGWLAWQAGDWVAAIGSFVGFVSVALTFLGRYQGDQRIHFFQPYTYEIPSTIVAKPPTTQLQQAMAAAAKPPAA